MKRLLLLFMTLASSTAGCGGVKTGSGSADAGPDGDHRRDGGGSDDGGTNDDGRDGGGSDSCVLGTSQLGSCSL